MKCHILFSPEIKKNIASLLSAGLTCSESYSCDDISFPGFFNESSSRENRSCNKVIWPWEVLEECGGGMHPPEGQLWEDSGGVTAPCRKISGPAERSPRSSDTATGTLETLPPTHPHPSLTHTHPHKKVCAILPWLCSIINLNRMKYRTHFHRKVCPGANQCWSGSVCNGVLSSF